jgi:hypothetical protein
MKTNALTLFVLMLRRKKMRHQTDNETPARRPNEDQRMITAHRVVFYAALAAAALTGGPSFAQQITGTPGGAQ